MTRRLLIATAAAAALSWTPASAATVGESVKADMPSLMTLYRDFHSNPELSMQEVRTPARLAAEARRLGFTVTEHVGKTGVVAVLQERPRPDPADPRRYGCAAGGRADRPALRLQGPRHRPFGSRDRRHARLRP